MDKRWKIEFKVDGKVTKTFRNQTGDQLRRLRNHWARTKSNERSEYYNTSLHFEAEPNIKSVK